ncbi:MAG: hypothetical protein KDK72_09640 [Chlamydiia bacterium]|nr:hypothetical protein [Chlamydiia bacterium]
MANMIPVNFMTQELKDSFTNSITEKMPPYLKEKYALFLPDVFIKVEEISLNLLAVLREEAKKGKYEYNLSSVRITKPEEILEKEHFEIIVKNAFKVLDLLGEMKLLQNTNWREDKHCKHSSPFPKVIQNSVFMRCYTTELCWSPDNPYLYPANVKQIEPINFAEIHYQNALGKIQTNFTLVDSEGNETYFHTSYLNGHTDYFKNSLKAEFKDTERLETQLSKEAMECLQQFVYLQEISHESIHSIIVVCELLDFTRMTLMENLNRTMINRMIILVGNHDLSSNDVLHLISEGIKSEREEWIIHGLKVAEKLEILSDAEKVSWDLLAQTTLHTLLINATDYKLTHTQKKILQTLNALCQQTSSDRFNEME